MAVRPRGGAGRAPVVQSEASWSMGEPSQSPGRMPRRRRPSSYKMILLLVCPDKHLVRGVGMTLPLTQWLWASGGERRDAVACPGAGRERTQCDCVGSRCSKVEVMAGG